MTRFFFFSTALLVGCLFFACEKESLTTIENENKVVQERQFDFQGQSYSLPLDGEEIERILNSKYGYYEKDADKRFLQLVAIFQEINGIKVNQELKSGSSCAVNEDPPIENIDPANGVLWKLLRGDVCAGQRFILSTQVSVTDQDGTMLFDSDADIFEINDTYAQALSSVNNDSNGSGLSNSIFRLQAYAAIVTLEGDLVTGTLFEKNLVPPSNSGSGDYAFDCTSDEYVKVESRFKLRDRVTGDGPVDFEINLFAGCKDD